MGLIENNLLPIAWALLGLSAVAIPWALFWDRPRGRLRCRKCRYRMEGTPPAADGSITCPECGRTHKDERSTRFTRRRYKTATLAILVALTSWYAVDYHWRFNERGWWGYVPTTALVTLPATAETWLIASDASTGSALESEIAYRSHEIGMPLWQERLWVRNLRRSAESRADGDWKWRFVEKSNLSGRQWVRHECSSWCTMIQHGMRSACPGDGALQLKVQSVNDGSIWGWESSRSFYSIAAVRGIEVQEAKYKHTRSIPTPCFATSDWDWPSHSAYESYYTDHRGERLVQEGLQLLRAPPNWRPNNGWISTPTVSYTIEGSPSLLAKFDLSAFYEAAGIESDTPATGGERWRFTIWLCDESGYDIYGDGSIIAGDPAVAWAFEDALYIAASRQALEEAGMHLQALYEAVYPGCWEAKVR